MAARFPALARAALAGLEAIVVPALLSAQAASPKPLLEASVWGAYTTFSDPPTVGTSSKDAGAGIRTAELAVWPSAEFRIFGRYDNSLSLDNLTLVRAGRRVPTWIGGTLFNWSGRFTTVLEAGHRTLPGRVGQTIIGGEQVVYSRSGVAFKAGGRLYPSSDSRTEWMLHGGVNFPLGAGIRIEPTFFYSRTGIAGESQWRGLLAANARAGRLELNGGVARGHNTSVNGLYTGGVWDLFAGVWVPLGGFHRANLMVRHESAAGASRLTSVSAGFTLGIPRP